MPVNLSPEKEFIEELIKSDGIRIERIISTGNISPDNEWYDQQEDEWVVLITGEAEITFYDNSKLKLYAGDFIHIPARKRHRVTYTSTEPPAIWLAVFFKCNSQ